jgi:hypothetical protein
VEVSLLIILKKENLPMQQTNRNKPSAGVLKGIKIVIASGAVAGAMGIWSMLAGKALNNSNVQAQGQDDTGLAELPTLIPYVAVQASGVNPAVDNTLTGLRNVTGPTTQNTTVQAAPVVQTMVIAAPSGGGGGGGGKKAAARTTSSRKK